MEDIIKALYKEFDKTYEDYELPLENAAYNYYYAGFKAAIDLAEKSGYVITFNNERHKNKVNN